MLAVGPFGRSKRVPRPSGQQLGAVPNQRPNLLEEARAVGAKVVGDELARKLGPTGGRFIGLFAWSDRHSPPVCGSCG